MVPPRAVVALGVALVALPFAVLVGSRLAAASQNAPEVFVAVGLALVVAGLFLEFLSAEPPALIARSGGEE